VRDETNRSCEGGLDQRPEHQLAISPAIGTQLECCRNRQPGFQERLKRDDVGDLVRWLHKLTRQVADPGDQSPERRVGSERGETQTLEIFPGKRSAPPSQRMIGAAKQTDLVLNEGLVQQIGQCLEIAAEAEVCLAPRTG